MPPWTKLITTWSKSWSNENKNTSFSIVPVLSHYREKWDCVWNVCWCSEAQLVSSETSMKAEHLVSFSARIAPVPAVALNWSETKSIQQRYSKISGESDDFDQKHMNQGSFSDITLCASKKTQNTDSYHIHNCTKLVSPVHFITAETSWFKT